MCCSGFVLDRVLADSRQPSVVCRFIIILWFIHLDLFVLANEVLKYHLIGRNRILGYSDSYFSSLGTEGAL